AGIIQNGLTGTSALGLTIDGGGTLTLSGFNTFTGQTTISGGSTIEAGPDTAFAAIVGAGLVFFNNGTFHVTGNSGDVITAVDRVGNTPRWTTTTNASTAASTGTFNVDAGVTLVLPSGGS